jgi:hypothetical protein
LQFRAGLVRPKSPEGIRNNAVPGRVLGEADAQRPRLTASYASRARCRLVDRLKDAPCILQK